MKHLLVTLALLIPLTGAEAQTHVEIRWGGTIGSYASSRAGLDIAPKISVDALVRRDLAPWAAVYGAFSRLRFGCEEQFCAGSQVTITGTHGVIGAETGWGGLWARGGAMFGTAAISTADEPRIGFGVQAAVGVRFDVYGVDLVPGFFLERMQARNTTEDDWATAISVDLGISYPFWF